MDPTARAAYVDQLRDKERVHALCEDYRAGATVDMEEQRRDVKDGKKIKVPLRPLWGSKGLVHKKFDALAEWKKVSEDGLVSGEAVESGHYIPEENPDVVIKNILEFFKD